MEEILDRLVEDGEGKPPLLVYRKRYDLDSFYPTPIEEGWVLMFEREASFIFWWMEIKDGIMILHRGFKPFVPKKSYTVTPEDWRKHQWLKN